MAGDIDFDKNNNLWFVTGDDTPRAVGGNAGDFGPFNDMKTDETQTVRVNNATGGTFTLTFDGQTTAPIAYNADRRAQIQAALEGLPTSRPATSRDRQRGTARPSTRRCVHGHQRGEGRAAGDGNATALTGTTADRRRSPRHAARAACTRRRSSTPAARR